VLVDIAVDGLAGEALADPLPETARHTKEPTPLNRPWVPPPRLRPDAVGTLTTTWSPGMSAV
jgi:hypothetical protein